jgi:hypothetical protein
MMEDDDVMMLSLLVNCLRRRGLPLLTLLDDGDTYKDLLECALCFQAPLCAAYLLCAESSLWAHRFYTENPSPTLDSYFQYAVYGSMNVVTRMLAFLHPAYLWMPWVQTHILDDHDIDTSIQAIIDTRTKPPSLEQLCMAKVYFLLGSDPITKFNQLQIAHTIKDSFMAVMLAYK